VKARGKEPRDSVEGLFDPLAGDSALLVIEGGLMFLIYEHLLLVL
jgi:hypothetical protein